ncbi:hypothetical protein J437_LFUL015063 [Ladona fulva]|uniref:Uncharacterized protein n=1 Tax=Ladona fulva TaxID=123851 RepID=A0A8K0P8F2_LADFU|nr:hypothetical protein J437_LFUL015063 [Ladona fulva]
MFFYKLYSSISGFWVNVSEERKSNSSNLCVWAITDPPQLPPGIAWEKVITPTSPVPTPKAVAVETEMPEADDEGKENEPHDIALDTSIHIIPELTPSLDPSVIVPKTIIRKVMVLPENAGYPGFCEPTEAELKQKSKKMSSKEIMGENKSAVSKHKDQLKSKKRPNLRKEQPQKAAAAHVHKVSKKNGKSAFIFQVKIRIKHYRSFLNR